MGKSFQFEIEYVNRNGRFIKSSYCSCYDTYNRADEEMCIEMSRLEDDGCTEVQGSVKEI